MKNKSAVQFETNSRIHMGLAVKDLEQSVAFYRTLLGHAPTKTRPGYAKFEVAQPPVNLSLNRMSGKTGPNNAVAHFGIQVKSPEAVKAYSQRFADTGLETKIEEDVTCCFAVQDKVWVSDPDGNNWEVYVVLDDNGAQHASSPNDCCGSDCRESERADDCCAQVIPSCCCS